MKRILLCHDGANLTPKFTQVLHKELEQAAVLDVLYVIPQNLIHYGQVDQLATPHSKQNFIDYVQQIGIDECKNKLHNFVEQTNIFIKEGNLNLTIQLHVRWGNAINAIKEIIEGYNSTMLLIPCTVWGLNWTSQKNLSTAVNIDPQSLHIL